MNFEEEYKIIYELAAILFLLVPLPLLVLEILFYAGVLLTVFCLILSLKNHAKFLLRTLYYFLLLSHVICIVFTRYAIFNYLERNQMLVLKLVTNFTCSDSFIIGFLVAVLLFHVQLRFIKKGNLRNIEKIARFCLDSMSQTFFDIDNKLNAGKIFKEEASLEKEKVLKYVDLYSEFDAIVKILKLNLIFTFLAFLVNIVCGIYFKRPYLNINLNETIESVIKMAACNMIIFLLPMIFVTAELSFCYEKVEKTAPDMHKDYPALEGNPVIIEELKKLQKRLEKTVDEK